MKSSHETLSAQNVDASALQLPEAAIASIRTASAKAGRSLSQLADEICTFRSALTVFRMGAWEAERDDADRVYWPRVLETIEKLAPDDQKVDELLSGVFDELARNLAGALEASAPKSVPPDLLSDVILAASGEDLPEEKLIEVFRRVTESSAQDPAYNDASIAFVRAMGRKGWEFRMETRSSGSQNIAQSTLRLRKRTKASHKRVTAKRAVTPSTSA